METKNRYKHFLCFEGNSMQLEQDIMTGVSHKAGNYLSWDWTKTNVEHIINYKL